MKNTKDNKTRLDDANIKLGKELLEIKSSLAIYGIIGLNAAKIRCGGKFFGYLQRQSLVAVVLRLSKVFENEKGHELCSVRGVFRLARQVPIQADSVLQTFVSKYGVGSSGNWIRDVDQVLFKQRTKITTSMQRINRARNTQIAHMQEKAPMGNLPSIAAFEELLGFAFDFHSFVNAAFLNTHSHPILQDREIESSLLNVLRKTGVDDVISKFKEDGERGGC